MNVGLLLARAVLGLLMAAHGSQKLFGWFGGHGLAGTAGFFETLGFRPGRLFAAAAAGTEIASGLLVALGLLGPIGPALMLAVMIVAGISVHWPGGLFAMSNGIELPLLYATGASALALTGPGAYSLDALLGFTRVWTPGMAWAALALAVAGAAGNLAMRRAVAVVASAALALVIAAPGTASAQAPEQKLAQFQAAGTLVAQHLATFDELDYVVFTGQQWARLHESHSHDVVVHWPDGHATTGIEKHIEDLKAMFVYAPDTRIKVHTVKLGQGEWTAVIGVMEGTFTKPMPIGGGKFIQPTGKPYKITMCTVGHWKDGVMNEEYLFWDNQTFMKQLGLGQ